ncbi:hypothetical protein CASFOL_033853 [Castilleja foliolosa]|uniref:mannan endo-1,4-beta-mannosidase n=1 Tax=Castilleja foliolosa TaxID=1961234 RepID=A0ABD3C0R7_9LAMI
MLRKSLLAIFFVIAALLTRHGEARPGRDGFVGTNGTKFVLNGSSFYFNGFNAYWLMYMASDPTTRVNVTDTFKQASKYGMNVVRTWAFSDGVKDRPLQATPGNYSEVMFKGLDFVVSKAKKHGLYLILSLVNNWNDYGGKKQYVQWAKDQGQNLTNDNEFFTSNITKGYYKNHIKSVLTRVNSINGVTYKDDSTILGWELMNEPRCQSDLSGKSIQDWVSEMSAYVKSIDNSHLLEIGLEGYYGKLMNPEKRRNNPANYEIGTDFISNNLITQIDFATMHLYPDQWLPNTTETIKAKFVQKWIKAHIDDSQSVLHKPILLTEFGKSLNSTNHNTSARDAYFRNIYNRVFNNARSGGACGGALFWQVMAIGMKSWSDTYDVVLEQSNSTDAVIKKQSERMAFLSK